MEKSKLSSCFLKYFNILLGILMLVILSLNIEAIFQAHRLKELGILKKNSSQLNDPLNSMEQCQLCQQESFNLLTIINRKNFKILNSWYIYMRINFFF